MPLLPPPQAADPASNVRVSSFLPTAARTTQNTACRDVSAAAASPRAPTAQHAPPLLQRRCSHPRTPPGCNSLQHPLSLGTEHIPWAPTSHQPPAVCDRAHTGLFFQHSAATPAGRRKVGRSQPGAAPPDHPPRPGSWCRQRKPCGGNRGGRQHHSLPKPGLPARSQEAPSGLTTRAEKKDVFFPEPTGEKSGLLKRERLHGNSGSKEEEGPEGRRSGRF